MSQSQPIGILRGLIGGVVGGIVGFYVFGWILRQGLYGMILPGAFVGFGWALGTRERSVVCGIGCAAGAVALGVFTEWSYLPFVKDNSLPYFLSNVHKLSTIHLLMIAVGGYLAFTSAKGYGLR